MALVSQADDPMKTERLGGASVASEFWVGYPVCVSTGGASNFENSDERIRRLRNDYRRTNALSAVRFSLTVWGTPAAILASTPRFCLCACTACCDFAPIGGSGSGLR
jgi:hypothetical protein